MMMMQISRDMARELVRAESWIPWIFRGVRVVVILGERGCSRSSRGGCCEGCAAMPCAL